VRLRRYALCCVASCRVVILCVVCRVVSCCDITSVCTGLTEPYLLVEYEVFST